MTLLLTAEDLASIIDMSRAVDLLADVAREYATGTASDIPSMGGAQRGSLRLLGGGLEGFGRAGLRAGLRGAISLLFETGSWEPLAVMGAPFSRLRVGASAGVAARYLSRPDATSIAMLGSGKNALAILTGICAVRPIQRATVYSPTPAHRTDFAKLAEASVGFPVVPTETRDEALHEADIIAIMTNSLTPVLAGDDLRAGCHVASMGMETELDASVYLQADRFVATSRELEMYNVDPRNNPVSRLVPPLHRLLVEERLAPDAIVSLGDVVSGRVPARHRPTDTTVYRDSRVGTHEVAFLSYAYDRARERGLGVEFDFGSEPPSTWRPAGRPRHVPGRADQGQE